MALLKELLEKNKPAGGASGNNSLGSIALEVISYDSDEVAVTGKVLIGPNEGSEIVVKSNDKNKEKNKDNIKKGMGGTTGSILLLENCYQMKDHIQSSWFTTGVSAAKKLDKETGHHARMVTTLQMETPVINFKNPSQKPGEPERIRWPVNAPTMNLDRVEYDRNWFRAKLAEMNGGVQVSALAVYPEKSVKVDSVESALNEVEAILSEPGSVAFVRANDGETAMVSRVYPISKKQGDDYVPDIDGVIARLKENGLLRGIADNGAVDDLIQQGLVLEVMPAKKIAFLGDTAKLVVSDMVKTDLPDLSNYTIRFGAKPNETSEVIAVLQPTKSGDFSVAGLPIALSRTRIESNMVKSKFFDIEPLNQAQQAAPDADYASDGAEFGVDDDGVILVSESQAAALSAPAAEEQQVSIREDAQPAAQTQTSVRRPGAKF